MSTSGHLPGLQPLIHPGPICRAWEGCPQERGGPASVQILRPGHLVRAVSQGPTRSQHGPRGPSTLGIRALGIRALGIRARLQSPGRSGPSSKASPSLGDGGGGAVAKS